MTAPPRRAKKAQGPATPLLVIVAVVLGFFAMAILPRILEQTHALVGKPVPAISLVPLADTPASSAHPSIAPVELAANKGRVVVLDFWAPWCGPCKMEMPVLDRLARKYADRGVVVIGVLVDSDRTGARRVLHDLGIAYPQLDDLRGEAAQSFSIRTLPTLVVVDREGKVKSYRTGYSPEEDLEAAIERAL